MLALTLALAIGGCPPAAELERRVEAACVRVGDAKIGGLGSGVAVGTRDGSVYILTAAHLITRSTRLEVQWRAGPTDPLIVTRDVELLTHDPLPDVALLRVNDARLKVTPLPLAGMAPLTDEEDPFAAISTGWGGTAFVSRAEQVRGKKLLRRADGKASFVWECRDRPERGRSGGPLVDLHGTVIGICSGTQEGKGYYCHQDEIAAMLRKHNHAWLYQRGRDR